MDIGEVRTYAEAFARTLARGDARMVASYLAPERAADIEELLATIPRPITATEIVMVASVPAGYSPEESPEEFVSITEFSGPRGGALLYCRWIANDARVVIRLVQIV